MTAIVRACDALDRYYGRKEWTERTPILDELIRTILSQNTTAKNCNEAFSRLRARFPEWKQVKDARWEDIAEAISIGGLANRKAPRIKAILEQVHERNSQIDLEWIAELSDEQAVDYLLKFEGVGRKTAACVLLFAINRPVFPVDTHVYRISVRLGLIDDVGATKAHDLLQAMVPRDRVYSFHMNMVQHGRQICHARGPECDRCPLKEGCKYFAEQAANCR